MELEKPLLDLCLDLDVEEIVVAMERRRRNDGPGGLPIDALLDCRMSGINVVNIVAFFEREAGKIELDLVTPAAIAFADGFNQTPLRAACIRTFDILAAITLLLVALPVMLVTALAIQIESRFKEPVLYRQERVGLNGKTFMVTKFRSMTVDAEKDGAVWAAKNDARVTRVGAFIRRTRIDELPQLLNVIRGEMSFVGPRPERPEFVEQLSAAIPMYNERHRVKPGITGWAQLCYPYGASIEESRQKLQYDLYYLKNHSLLLDIIILIQTVEVVLVGEGAR